MIVAKKIQNQFIQWNSLFLCSYLYVMCIVYSIIDSITVRMKGHLKKGSTQFANSSQSIRLLLKIREFLVNTSYKKGSFCLPIFGILPISTYCSLPLFHNRNSSFFLSNNLNNEISKIPGFWYTSYLYRIGQIKLTSQQLKS